MILSYLPWTVAKIDQTIYFLKCEPASVVTIQKAASTRSHDVEIQVKYLENGDLELTYDGAKAVTPGQFCCLYQGDLCLGGGIIKEVF